MVIVDIVVFCVIVGTIVLLIDYHSVGFGIVSAALCYYRCALEYPLLLFLDIIILLLSVALIIPIIPTLCLMLIPPTLIIIVMSACWIVPSQLVLVLKVKRQIPLTTIIQGLHQLIIALVIVIVFNLRGYLTPLVFVLLQL